MIVAALDAFQRRYGLVGATLAACLQCFSLDVTGIVAEYAQEWRFRRTLPVRANEFVCSKAGDRIYALYDNKVVQVYDGQGHYIRSKSLDTYPSATKPIFAGAEVFDMALDEENAQLFVLLAAPDQTWMNYVIVLDLTSMEWTRHRCVELDVLKAGSCCVTPTSLVIVDDARSRLVCFNKHTLKCELTLADQNIPEGICDLRLDRDGHLCMLGAAELHFAVYNTSGELIHQHTLPKFFSLPYTTARFVVLPNGDILLSTGTSGNGFVQLFSSIRDKLTKKDLAWAPCETRPWRPCAYHTLQYCDNGELLLLNETHIDVYSY